MCVCIVCVYVYISVSMCMFFFLNTEAYSNIGKLAYYYVWSCVLFMLSNLWVTRKICLSRCLPLFGFSLQSFICWVSSFITRNKRRIEIPFHLNLLNLKVNGLLCDQLHQKVLGLYTDSSSGAYGCDVGSDQVFTPIFPVSVFIFPVFT